MVRDADQPVDEADWFPEALDNSGSSFCSPMIFHPCDLCKLTLSEKSRKLIT
jgi:hypothetical protein